ncbi:hypothetical protein M0802_016549 [Mischocyttarus mexicanus]|nr:hypothetical protein M0802_016549 [Mischocyttarus mexicanus]
MCNVPTGFSCLRFFPPPPPPPPPPKPSPLPPPRISSAHLTPLPFGYHSVEEVGKEGWNEGRRKGDEHLSNGTTKDESSWQEGLPERSLTAFKRTSENWGSKRVRVGIEEDQGLKSQSSLWATRLGSSWLDCFKHLRVLPIQVSCKRDDDEGEQRCLSVRLTPDLHKEIACLLLPFPPPKGIS